MAASKTYIKNIIGNNITLRYNDDGILIQKVLPPGKSVQVSLDQADQIQYSIGESVISVQEENI